MIPDHRLRTHLDEVLSLWMLRDHAVRSHRSSIRTLDFADRRLLANLVAVDLRGAEGWLRCRKLLVDGEPGAYVGAGFLAFSHPEDPTRLRQLLFELAQRPTLLDCTAAAGLWCRSLTNQVSETLWYSELPLARALALAIELASGRDTDALLREGLRASDPFLQRVACRGVWHTRQSRLRFEVETLLDSTEPDIRFEAARAGAVLGSERGLAALRSIAHGNGMHATEATDLLVRCMPGARQWLEQVRGVLPTREVIRAVGALGDPALVPWLLGALDDPDLSRCAGAMFEQITGLQLAKSNMTVAPPARGVNEQEDARPVLDPDAALPWPNPSALRDWWAAHGNHYVFGQKYLAGRVCTRESLATLLANGSQPLRHAASWEFLVRGWTAKWFDPSAPAFVQRQRMYSFTVT